MSSDSKMMITRITSLLIKPVNANLENRSDGCSDIGSSGQWNPFPTPQKSNGSGLERGVALAEGLIYLVIIMNGKV